MKEPVCPADKPGLYSRGERESWRTVWDGGGGGGGVQHGHICVLEMLLSGRGWAQRGWRWEFG